jgi:hypothetical protein
MREFGTALRLAEELARTHISVKRIQKRVLRVTGLRLDGRTIAGLVRTSTRKVA